MGINNIQCWAIALSAMLAATSSARAQCDSYGPPIINITFGNAANPMTRLPAENTEYTLHENIGQFLPYNYYMITDNVINAASPGHVGAYHNLRDHTGDPGGGMFLVNAAEEPGIFYTNVLTELCANTDFNFSAWVVNASPPVLSTCPDDYAWPVNVQFEIYNMDGDILAIHATGDLEGEDNPVWRQFNVSFNTGDDTAVRLVMRNLGPGGCGNNLAIDDIQFRPCGPGITLTSAPETNDNHTILLCVGETTATITATLGDGYTVPVYQWQQRLAGIDTWEDIVGENDPTLTVVQADQEVWYRLAAASSIENMENGTCHIISDSLRVQFAQVPRVDYEVMHISACVGNPVQLEPVDVVIPDIGTLTYRWYVRDGENWEAIPDGDENFHSPPTDQAGAFHYQRRAFNPCVGDFPVNEFQIELVLPENVEFDLPLAIVCLDQREVVLTGGKPERFLNGEPGIYSGPGVVDGIFYPALAGVGEHIITYSQPAGPSCTALAEATIRVVDSITFRVREQPMVQAGHSVRLNLETNATAFSWDPEPTLDRYDIRNPVATPDRTTTYRVTARNEAGCERDTTLTVVVMNDISIPNSFTPNGDGINDTWEITGLDTYPNVHLQVFNRWGMLVFSSKGYTTPWNGQYNGALLPSATYYYTLSSDGLQRPLSGTVTILF